MSGAPALQGHVDSISRGITDREDPDGPELLANVNPTFEWVRLAQRIPVRIHIDSGSRQRADQLGHDMHCRRDGAATSVGDFRALPRQRHGDLPSCFSLKNCDATAVRRAQP